VQLLVTLQALPPLPQVPMRKQLLKLVTAKQKPKLEQVQTQA
jgi:hypothetical protein